jgi:predicted enzyme related to lactoylglutathione lyase
MPPTFQPPLTISVSVSDWEAARRWYAEKLGLQENFVTDEGRWAEFDGPGGVIIGLSDLRGEPHPGPGGVSLAFGVEDLHATRAQMEADGVEFLGPTEELPGMVRLAAFRDPDGNVMTLAQSLMQP